MPEIPANQALQRINDMVERLYLAHLGDDGFWGRSEVEIIWERGKPKQINVTDRMTNKVVDK